MILFHSKDDIDDLSYRAGSGRKSNSPRQLK
jgi:hypothetical protein